MRRNRQIIIILGLAVIVLLWMWAPLYRQEGNPVPFISAAARLSTNRTAIEPISTLPGGYLIRSGDGIAPLVKLMEAQGWQYQEQLRAGIIFYQDGNLMTAVSRMYSRLYICLLYTSDAADE